VTDLLAAVWSRKRYWLMPLLVFAALIAALLFLRASGEVRWPFLYPSR
jgi:hypothetical protein